MKTPITYYGGKQKLVKMILPLIPAHNCYVEPFFGGGAIFFAKEPSNVECINDINNFVINFYKVLKRNYNELKEMLDITLHSRQQYSDARNIYNNPLEYNDIQKAWAFWVLSQESYGSSFNKGWGFEKKRNNKTLSIKNKIDNFTEEYSARLRITQIECNDAIKVINNFDSEDTFFYLDPPYFNADMGPYKGYMIDDYKTLLETIAGIKGKFLLSSYPSSILEEYKDTNKWEQIEINLFISVSSNLKEKKRKTEVLTKNY
jgi:DNA adenine methylase